MHGSWSWALLALLYVASCTKSSGCFYWLLQSSLSEDLDHHAGKRRSGETQERNKRAHPDLNQGRADLQSAALTTELCTRMPPIAILDCASQFKSRQNVSRALVQIYTRGKYHSHRRNAHPQHGNLPILRKRFPAEEGKQKSKLSMHHAYSDASLSTAGAKYVHHMAKKA